MFKIMPFALQFSNIIHRAPCLLPSTRKYVVYSLDKYMKPLTDPQQLEEVLQNEEIKEKLQFSQIKPADYCRSWSFFDHPRVSSLCNFVMKEGNKTLARELVEEAFERVKRKQLRAYHTAKDDDERSNIVCDPHTIFLGALENCRPFLDLQPIRRGGIVYQVPVPMSEGRSYFVAMRWLVHAGRDRPHRRVHFPENLANELVDAFYSRGRVVQQKNDLHKQCEANRAYAHYRS